MGQFPLHNGVLLMIAICIGKPRWPMGKNSGNVNGVCRSLGAVTGQVTYQKVRCRRISLNPLRLAATVLGLKLTWFRLNLEREIQNFKSVIGSDQRDSREML